MAGSSPTEPAYLRIGIPASSRPSRSGFPQIARAITAHSALKRDYLPRRQSWQRAVESRLRWATDRGPRHEEQRTSRSDPPVGEALLEQ